MFELLDSGVLPENRSIVARFLGDRTFCALELLLRNINEDDTALNVLETGEVKDKLNSFTVEEEARMEKNLNGVAYNIDDVNTVSLITGTHFKSVLLLFAVSRYVLGPGRIERVRLSNIFLIFH
jgi:hypothetical protein